MIVLWCHQLTHWQNTNHCSCTTIQLININQQLKICQMIQTISVIHVEFKDWTMCMEQSMRQNSMSINLDSGVLWLPHIRSKFVEWSPSHHVWVCWQKPRLCNQAVLLVEMVLCFTMLPASFPKDPGLQSKKRVDQARFTVGSKLWEKCILWHCYAGICGPY